MKLACAATFVGKAVHERVDLAGIGEPVLFDPRVGAENSVVAWGASWRLLVWRRPCGRRAEPAARARKS